MTIKKDKFITQVSTTLILLIFALFWFGFTFNALIFIAFWVLANVVFDFITASIRGK